MLRSLAIVSILAPRRAVAATAYLSRGASTVSETTATGVNYFKTGEDPPLKADSEYPDWLWTISEPPPSLFTLERKYSDDDALTDENYNDIQRMVKLQNIREIKDLNAIKAKK